MRADHLLARITCRSPGKNPTDANGTLTVVELERLADWAEAYRAEAMYGAQDGKKWAFARYLRKTHRLSEAL
jgi:hypothetical protein